MNRQEFLGWLATVPEDEPIFCVRAKDNLALRAMGAWLDMARRVCSAAKIKGVEGYEREFIQWRNANPDKCKVPD